MWKNLKEASALSHKKLYTFCHSGLDPESSVFPLGQVPPQRGFYPGGRPFWAGGNLDSLRARGPMGRRPAGVYPVLDTGLE